ncbi:MAG: phosphoadenosine phosphosulfate reductase family protein [Elusimicrobiota bacterium]
MRKTNFKTQKLKKKFESKKPDEILRRVKEEFGESLIMTSSFGRYSTALLHKVTRIIPGIKVIFIDTGYYPRKNYLFIDKISRKMNLNLRVFSAGRSRKMQESVEGKRWKKGGEEFIDFKNENKVRPLNRALKILETRAWISGARREESGRRKNFSHVMYDKEREIYRIYPILDWGKRKVQEYIMRNNLDTNLFYHDICKGPKQSKECGLHIFEKGSGI